MADYLMEVARWMTLGLAGGLALGTLGRPVVVWARRHRHHRG